MSSLWVLSVIYKDVSRPSNSGKQLLLRIGISRLWPPWPIVARARPGGQLRLHCLGKEGIRARLQETGFSVHRIPRHVPRLRASSEKQDGGLAVCGLRWPGRAVRPLRHSMCRANNARWGRRPVRQWPPARGQCGQASLFA